ncbi:MAG TPA: hypothetical protein VFV99_14490 [Kofleriaceae bacterium]|nr:hypothetical protein [Kofleriaceae bacterium]
MRWLLLVALLVGCNSDLDEPWQLEHDRIIAIRATPPRILSGETSTIDVLLGFSAAEMPVVERGPDVATVVSPMSLMDTLANDNGNWVVTAPSEERLAAAREELELEPGAPVPLVVGIAVAWPYEIVTPQGNAFGGAKTLWLGESATNPELTGMLINGIEPGAELVVPKEVKVPLFVEADDKIDIVNWLTSCGEMHDFDLHKAYLKVLPDQPQDGQLAVVKRDDRGGVSWRVWPIRAE